MFYGFFSFRNDVAEMKLKLADTYLKLGEIGMETGTLLVAVGRRSFASAYNVSLEEFKWLLKTHLFGDHGAV